MSARILTRRIHLISSLVAGLWLAISGLAGSLLVFGDELDRVLHPELFTVRGSGGVDLQPIVERLQQDGTVVTRIRLAGDATPVHELWLDCDRCGRAFVDPSTGIVNGVRSHRGTTRLWLLELHRYMFAGETGQKIVGVGGIALITLSITGMIVWWPKRRLRDGFTIARKSNWRRLNFDLHRVGGILIMPMLLIAGASGIYFVFHGPFDRVAAAIDGPAASVPALSQPEAAGMSIDAMMAIAQAQFPRATMTWVQPWNGGSMPPMTRFRQEPERHPNGRTFVYVDPTSGEVLSTRDGAAPTPARGVLDNLYPLHIGRLGGPLHRAATFIAGLAPVALFVTGILAWWNRSLRQTFRRRVALRRGASDSTSEAVTASGVTGRDNRARA